MRTLVDVRRGCTGAADRGEAPDKGTVIVLLKGLLFVLCCGWAAVEQQVVEVVKLWTYQVQDDARCFTARTRRHIHLQVHFIQPPWCEGSAEPEWIRRH